MTADGAHYLRATVSYTDGHGSGKSLSATTGNTVQTPLNSPPTFDEGASATRAVDENTAGGTDIGAAVAATDPDADDTLTYSLGGTDQASFAIDTATGQCRWGAA